MMTIPREQKPKWSPRVKGEMIRLLYERYAKGLADDELLDEVAFAIYTRCLSIMEVTEAVRGRVKCPGCTNVILHDRGVLECGMCGWTAQWQDYKKLYKGKQLFGGGAVQAFMNYLEELPKATSSDKKMLAIDRLLHECHKFPATVEEAQLFTRPAAINLIEGTVDTVFELLDGLAYGPEGAISDARERRELWRTRVNSAARMRYGSHS